MVRASTDGVVCLSADAPVAEIVLGVRLAPDGEHVFVSVSARATEASAAGIGRGVRLAAGGEQGFVSASEHPVPPAARVLGVLALTRREREVLKLLSNGRKHAEVAEALNVGVETARTHAKHVYRKLGVSSRKGLLGIEP